MIVYFAQSCIIVTTANGAAPYGHLVAHTTLCPTAANIAVYTMHRSVGFVGKVH